MYSDVKFIKKYGLIYLTNATKKPTEISKETLFLSFDLLSKPSTKSVFDQLALSLSKDPKKKIFGPDTTAAIKNRSIFMLVEANSSYKDKETRSKLFKYLYPLLVQELKYVLTLKPTAIEQRINYLAEIFKLSKLEKEILNFLSVVSMSYPFTHSMYDLRSYETNIFAYSRLAQAIGAMPFQVRRAFRSKEKLIAIGLVTCPGPNSLAQIKDSTINYITGDSGKSGHDRFFKEIKRKKSHALSGFNLKIEKIEIFKSLMNHKKGSHILLHGQAGVGKTSLAYSLAQSVGKKAFIIPSSDPTEGESRQPSIVAAREALDPKKHIIIVDEADRLLNTRHSFLYWGEKSDKSWLNEFLDEKRGHYIFISNETTNIPESTLRRFDSSAELPKFGMDYKTKLWIKIAKKHKVSGLAPGDFLQLAKKYEITPALIENTLRAIAPLSRPTVKHASSTYKLIEGELKHHQKLLQFNATNKSDVTSAYNIDYLNTDQPPKILLNSLNEYLKNIKSQANAPKNVSALFWGPPGTGKTELAKYLANELGKPLLTKRASDLISCYVGESEKNIAKAFEEAEQSESILFIDEADSFFSNREKAQRSWEVTQVNELLTQLENFNGVFFASTNFMKQLDPASLRRFNFKIKFEFLKSEARRNLYASLFNERCRPLSAEENQKLLTIPKLAFGDFKVVSEKSYFSKSLSNDEILTLLDAESKIKTHLDSKPIGINARI